MIKELNSKNVSFSVHVDSDIEFKRFETFEQKEPETLEWIRTFMGSDEVFVDIGANIGLYTLFAAAVHPNLQVFAFEPACNNFYKLSKNTVVNGFQNRVQIGGFGIGEQTEVLVLQLSSIEDGSASHALGAQVAQKERAIETFSHLTPVFALDTLVSNGVVPVPHHVKIDVDGTEGSVIAGMKETLKNHVLRSVLIEFDHQLSDTKIILDVMNRAGFVTTHSLNTMPGHSRERRTMQGSAHIENLIFTR